jgi:hypothetical protein
MAVKIASVGDSVHRSTASNGARHSPSSSARSNAMGGSTFLKKDQEMASLNPKQVKAIELLASGTSQKDAAKAVGVTPETVCGWHKAPDFQAALNRIKRESLDAARDLLRSCVGDAARTLQELMKPGKPDAIRLRSAVAVLELASEHCGSIGPTDAKKIERAAVLDAETDELFDNLFQPKQSYCVTAGQKNRRVI